MIFQHARKLDEHRDARRGLLSLRNHIPTRARLECLSVRNNHFRVVTPFTAGDGIRTLSAASSLSMRAGVVALLLTCKSKRRRAWRAF